ncbi:Sterol 14-demethylase, partial [Hondaea fermentalgiana]
KSNTKHKQASSISARIVLPQKRCYNRRNSAATIDAATRLEPTWQTDRPGQRQTLNARAPPDPWPELADASTRRPQRSASRVRTHARTHAARSLAGALAREVNGGGGGVCASGRSPARTGSENTMVTVCAASATGDVANTLQSSGALGFAWTVGGWIGTVTAALIVALVAFIFVYRMAKKDKAPAGYKLPPEFRSNIPVVGNFIGFASDPLGFVRQGYKECGNIFTIDMVAEKCTFLIGADAHKVFFEATDEEMDQARPYRFMKPIFGKGVVYDSPLKKRRQQMRALGRSLRPSVIKTYPPMIAAEVKSYLDSRWGDSGTVDLHKAFAELIINTASATLLGPEIRGEMFQEMSTLYAHLDNGLTPISVFFPNAPTAAHKSRDHARIEISALFSRILERRRADPEAAEKRSDMIKTLMEFTYSDGTKFTDDEIAGMILAALFAGQHTSSIVSTWSLLFLLEDKRNKGAKVFEKILDEIASLEEKPGLFASGDVPHDVVKEEVELYKVVKEAIRLHPPLIMLMREVMKPITMPDGTYIPAGHRAMVSNAIAQRLPEVFENPDEFDPSRWDDFNIAKLKPYSFIGFGAGLHTCMGESFAFMQVRTILTVILSTYELDLVTPFPEADYEAMVVPPKGPNMVRFKRRETPLSASRKVEPKVPKAPKAAAADSKIDEPSNAAEESKAEFTLEEIAKHNTKEDLWIIVKDRVFDVTTYLDLHQGGDNAIINFGGRDATEAVAGPQHPSTVPTLLERYHIGNVKK